MRAIVVVGPGEIELNYTFLPTFIGMNAILKKELEDELRPLIEGQPWTEAYLDQAHEYVLDFLEKRFSSIHGLREFLDGLKYVTDQ